MGAPNVQPRGSTCNLAGVQKGLVIPGERTTPAETYYSMISEIQKPDLNSHTPCTQRVFPAALTAKTDPLPRLEGDNAQQGIAASLENIFQDTFHLQVSAAGDLASAAKTFHALAIARRGDPWPGFCARYSRCPEAEDQGQRVGDHAAGGGDGLHSASCVDAFFAANEGKVQEFSARADHNYAVLSRGVSLRL